MVEGPLLKRLWQDEEGQDLVEYGLLVVLIGLFAIAAMGSLATAVSSVFSQAATNLTAAS
jgi:pilus assembly protein Flp/PilA